MIDNEEKPLIEKEGFVDDWEIRDRKNTHPSSSTAVLKYKDVKQAVERLKEAFCGCDYCDFTEESIKICPHCEKIDKIFGEFE